MKTKVRAHRILRQLRGYSDFNLANQKHEELKRIAQSSDEVGVYRGIDSEGLFILLTEDCLYLLKEKLMAHFRYTDIREIDFPKKDDGSELYITLYSGDRVRLFDFVTVEKRSEVFQFLRFLNRVRSDHEKED